MSKFLAFASAKGGVGKTTLATNIATLLNEAGQDVIIIDMNLSSPDVIHHFQSKYYPQTITDVLKGHVPLTGAIYSHDYGIKIVPASQNAHADKLFPKFHEILPELAEHTDWIVADFPPKIDGVTLNMLSTFDKVALVTTSDIIARKRAEELKSNLIRSFGNEPDIVINRHPSGIPEDWRMTSALDARAPIIMHEPMSRSSQALRLLLESLTGIKAPSPSSIKIMSLLR